MRGLNSRARRDDTRLLVDACCASSVVCLREANKLEVACLQMARSWSLLPAGAVSSPMQHASAAYGHASRACFVLQVPLPNCSLVLCSDLAGA